MRVLVPFDATAPKTRLDPLLSTRERESFARAMLADVIWAIENAGGDPTIIATETVDVSAPVTVDDRSLDDAINARLDEVTPPVAIVMADLPLATPDALDRLFDADGDVVLAPGRGGGTNAIVARHPDFRVDYHAGSFRDHCAIAERIDAAVTVIDSFRLATDIDEPADLAEVLLHGEGWAAGWLGNHGFELVSGEGRVSVER